MMSFGFTLLSVSCALVAVACALIATRCHREASAIGREAVGRLHRVTELRDSLNASGARYVGDVLRTDGKDYTIIHVGDDGLVVIDPASRITKWASAS